MHLRLLPLLLLLVPGLAWAEDAWVLRAIEAQRWPDAPKVSMSLAAGDQVTVIYRDAGLTRVRKEGKYGWVPDDALSSAAPVVAGEEAPAPAVPPEAP
ncbi:MAG: SH3 domain-containing protein [Pseudomonadota bacterium]